MRAARRYLSILVTVTLMGTIVLVGASSAPARPRCTLKGTRADDRLVDTGGANVICAKAGSDLVEAGVQADKVYGGAGDDQLEGNDGRDLVAGGRGTDTIVTADGVGGNDRAVGGRGEDTCYVDRGDRARGCETKHIVG